MPRFNVTITEIRKFYYGIDADDKDDAEEKAQKVHIASNGKKADDEELDHWDLEAEPECIHEWVDADNEVVKGGEVCVKCKHVRAKE